jgi:hypothetical protein
MLTEAFASVKRTPELLPRLREAGVVDSGGMGVAVILQGLVCGILDHPLPAEPLVTGTAEVKADAVEHEGHGFCTEFVISGAGLDRSTSRANQRQAFSIPWLVILDAAGARPCPAPGTHSSRWRCKALAARKAGGHHGSRGVDGRPRTTGPRPRGIARRCRGRRNAAAFRDSAGPRPLAGWAG